MNFFFVFFDSFSNFNIDIFLSDNDKYLINILITAEIIVEYNIWDNWYTILYAPSSI